MILIPVRVRDAMVGECISGVLTPYLRHQPSFTGTSPWARVKVDHARSLQVMQCRGSPRIGIGKTKGRGHPWHVSPGLSSHETRTRLHAGFEAGVIFRPCLTTDKSSRAGLDEMRREKGRHIREEQSSMLHRRIL